LQEISPGVVDTEIGGWKDKPEFQEMIKSTNLPRLDPSNIAQTVRFMLMTPYEVNITDIIVRPVGEAF
jgi:NADP-dependent 3-hydroxy acid dehydrogenase YdfG